MISIIIINYKSPYLTIQCIDSILLYTKNIDYEVILVDNESSQESFDILSDYYCNFTQVEVVKSITNLWFGWGNVLWVSYAKGDYYFFLNNDTLFFENSLKILLEDYEKYQPWFIQPKLFLNKQKTRIQETCAEIPTLFNLLQENIPFLQKIFPKIFDQFRYTSRDRLSSREVWSVCGAAMLCSKSDYIKIWWFDERFFMYFEEYDLHSGMKILWKRCFYTVRTSIIHLHNQSPSPSWKKKIIYLTSFLRYIIKYFLCTKK